jgi:predicted Zn finger-like uncharacterized protein
MPEIISCPECERKLRVPDHLLGKKVKCPGCGTMFTGRAAGEGEDVTPKTKPRAAAPREERVEEKPRAARRSVVPPPEEEYEEDRPRRRRRDEDEEDEDDRPRSRRRRDEEDEDDYDRPRARRRREEEEEEDEDYPRSARADAYDEDDEPGVSSRRARQGWRKVASGLNLASISGWIDVGLNGCTVIFYIILMISVFALISAAANPTPTRPGPGFGPGPGASPATPPSGGLAALGIFSCIFGALAIIGGLATVVLKSIGYGFLMAVPELRRGGLKPLAITTFSMFLAALVIYLLGCLIGFLMPVGLLLLMGSLVVFTFFMRGVALAAKDKALAGRLMLQLIAWGAFIALSMIGAGLMYYYAYSLIAGSLPGMGGSSGPPSAGAAVTGAVTMVYVALVFMGLIMMVGLGLYVWHILLIRQTRAVVERRLLRGG